MPIVKSNYAMEGRIAGPSGEGDGSEPKSAVNPGLGVVSDPGIHNHRLGLWIPGSPLRGAPE